MKFTPRFNLDSTRTASRSAVAKAFERLRSESGFQAFMRFSCCRACASVAIDRRMTLASRPEEFPVRIVFFTQRDDRAANATGVLKLTFGDVRLQNAARLKDREAGRLVVKALKLAGLAPEWDDDPNRRISIPVAPWIK